MIKKINISIPDKQYLDKFETIAQSAFAKIKANQWQIRTLMSLRDTLLPKLMCGKMRVRI
jgi:type I restriction enzyme S subunit